MSLVIILAVTCRSLIGSTPAYPVSLPRLVIFFHFKLTQSGISQPDGQDDRRVLPYAVLAHPDPVPG
jgi:hypothetical protein